MRRRFIISLAEVSEKLQPQIAALRAKGIDAQALLQYSIHMATQSDYNTLVGYISHDLLEVHPELLEDPHNYQRVLHSCIDYVGGAAQCLIPYIERACGPCDYTLMLDSFHGVDAIISVQTS